MSLSKSKGGVSGGMGKENKIILVAILAAVLVIILWWVYGYHYVIVPSGELSFRAP